MSKTKFKFRQDHYSEETKEFRKMDNRSLFEIASEWAANLESEVIRSGPNKIYALDFPFICYQDGFIKAKGIIRQFLLNKQMGYGDTFLFKISDFDEIGNEKENE